MREVNEGLLGCFFYHCRHSDGGARSAKGEVAMVEHLLPVLAPKGYRYILPVIVRTNGLGFAGEETASE